MAVLRLGGPRGNRRAISEGTVAVNDAATLDTGLSNITGGGIFHVATEPPERHISIRDIAASLASAIVFDVTGSLGTAITVLVTVGYILTGNYRRTA